MIEFNAYDPKQYKRLMKSVRHSYEQLRPFREVRDLVSEAARGHYYRTNADTPNAYRDPVNMMDQWSQALVRSFVNGTPRVRIASRDNPGIAKKFEVAVNETAVEIDLRGTIRRCTREAILGSLGVAYCGIAPTDLDPIGASFVDSIGLPNLVMDIDHERYNQADLVGHRFTRRIAELQASGAYNPEQLKHISGRDRESSQLSDKGTGRNETDEGALFDQADIWAINVKPAKQIVYLSESSGVTEPLRVESYYGPDYGPYIFLGFDEVLDEMMPNSRGALLLDLHDFVNGQYRRIMMSEDVAATFWTYEGGSEEDARRVKNAQDNEMVMVNNNGAVAKRTKGGTNPNSLATAIHSRQLFDDLSGHARRAQGASGSADTATEAKIDAASTSQLLQDMKEQVIQFTKEVFQNLAWYEWTHPTREQQVEILVGEGGHAVQDVLTPEERDGDFFQFEIDIIPDSFTHRTGEEQLAALMRGITQVVIPSMQMPSQKPVVLKTPELIQTYSELANIPEMENVVDYATDDSFVSPGANAGPAPSPGGGQPTPGPGAGGDQEGGGIVDRVLSGAISGGNGGPQDEGSQ